MTRASPQLDLRFLLGAFVGVAVSFVSANAFTQYAMRRIDVASDEIAYDAAPSIEHLAGLRTAVRHAEFLLSSAETMGDVEERATVEPALALVNDEANAYLALPIFPDEPPFWREIKDSLAAFNGEVQRALIYLDAGPSSATTSRLASVEASADRVSDAAARAIEFNAQNGRELALGVMKVRRSVAWVGYTLNAICVLLALAAGLLVQRQVRRYSALVEKHATLEESRAAELESFAARAAHDILNPVSATQLSLALTAKRDIQDPRARELIDRALRNLLRVRNIIDGLLQFARAGAKPSPGASADLPSVIEDVLDGIRATADAAAIELCVEVVPSCRAGCSVGVLTSIVSNLGHNAMKYMGDRVTRRITFRAVDGATFVRVEVEDTGPGIPPEVVDEIFLPYVRGPNQGKEGLGLGLATVKRLCETHGGRVGVRSALGRGSIFWIELPLANNPIAPPVTGVAATPSVRSPPRA
jgi:signal transduction histidine kinase